MKRVKTVSRLLTLVFLAASVSQIGAMKPEELTKTEQITKWSVQELEMRKILLQSYESGLKKLRALGSGFASTLTSLRERYQQFKKEKNSIMAEQTRGEIANHKRLIRDNALRVDSFLRINKASLANVAIKDSAMSFIARVWEQTSYMGHEVWASLTKVDVARFRRMVEENPKSSGAVVATAALVGWALYNLRSYLKGDAGSQEKETDIDEQTDTIVDVKVKVKKGKKKGKRNK